MTEQVIVLGAGMVGVCSALHLQKRGYDVTLIDRKLPGMETSYGNTGLINRGSIFPLSLPKIFQYLPQALLKSRPHVYVYLRYLPSYWHWLVELLLRSGKQNIESSILALNELLDHGLAEHKALLDESGGQSLLEEKGWLELYSTDKSFRSSGYQRSFYDRLSIDYKVLEKQGIQELEPDISSGFIRGMWVTGTASFTDPARVVQQYADAFRRCGGNFIQSTVHGISFADHSFRILTDHELLHSKKVVLALGPWSSDIYSQLGYHFPMAAERGYHQHFQPSDAFQIHRPIYDVDGGYVLAPMQQGIRLTTGVELSSRDAPPETRQLYQASTNARTAFSLGNPVGEVWLGSRPAMPDGLPVIGEASRHPGLWFAFGYGHCGVGTGAISGKVISELVSG